MPSIIQARKVTREFRVGGSIIRALDGVDITVKEGSFTLLQGPSGSGKTTLLNIMGALDVPTKGTVHLRDTDITILNDLQRDRLRRDEFGFVFQSIALISLMSAYENVEFRLRISGASFEESRERAETCLRLVSLHNRMDHRPHELSGGEQQRVAIARAISTKPSVLFADEPTGELDSHTGLQVVKVFRNLIENEGVSVIMTSHDPNMEELADRVIRLEDGRVVEIVEQGNAL